MELPQRVDILKKNKTILYLSPYFWPEEIGSAPYCTDVAKWLADKGHYLNVVSFRPHYPSTDQFPGWINGLRDSEKFGNLRIHRLKVVKRLSRNMTDRLRNDFKFACGVLRLHAVRPLSRADTVVAYVPSCLSILVGKIVTWRSGARLIGVVHDIESGLATSLGISKGKLILRAMRLVERVAYNSADRIIVLTDNMAAELRRLGVVVPITVLPIWASLAPRVKLEHRDNPIVMYSGNFGKKQDLSQLLPAIRKLDRKLPNVQIIFQGDGSESENIRSKIRTMGVQNTTFVPPISSEQFVKSLQSAEVHLVPQSVNTSTYAMPSKLISIMAAGRPFVCIAEKGTALHDITEQSGAGFCILPDSEADAVYNAIECLLEKKELGLEMGEKGRQYVKEHMERTTVLRMYEELIVGSDSP